MERSTLSSADSDRSLRDEVSESARWSTSFELKELNLDPLDPPPLPLAPPLPLPLPRPPPLPLPLPLLHMMVPRKIYVAIKVAHARYTLIN